MNLDIIIKIIIPILGAIVTYMIVPFIMQKTNKEKRDNIVFWVKFAGNAAEQMQEVGLIEMPKKEYVVRFIKNKGFDISYEDLEIILEAAVKELNLEQMQLNKMIVN